MRLSINGGSSTREVQEEFNRVYPFLKIVFSTLPANLKHKTGEADRISPRKGEMEFTERITVSELEEALQDLFGLRAQVFRKVGNIWLETSITDHWSLQEQNEQGREISGKIEGLFS